MELIKVGFKIEKIDFTAAQKDLLFDVKSAVKFAQDYSLSTGVDCSIIDAKGGVIFTSSSHRQTCKGCRQLQTYLKEEFSCSSVYLYGNYQAERLGGKDIFFCPVGFAHWAAPIIVDGIMQGGFIGGPVVLTEHDDFVRETIVHKYQISDEDVQTIRSFVKDIRYVHPSRMASLADLLMVISRYITESESVNDQEILEQSAEQATISDNIYLFTSMGGEENENVHYPLEKERELLFMISRGDKAGARKTLNEILGHVFFSSDGKFEVIKARVLELVVLLSRAALEGGAEIDEIFGMNYKYLREIHSFTSVEQLATWLSRIMNRFSDCVFNLTDVKHVDVIYKTLDYVKKNYMNKISLSDVAGNAHISPSYFSKIFKDEMKGNFNTYLNQVRIQNSKKLLLDDAVSLVDVAFLCGYEDQSYFSKVFKKMVGMSPGKYRESMGRTKQLEIS